jgi:hypothetical protein
MTPLYGAAFTHATKAPEELKAAFLYVMDRVSSDEYRGAITPPSLCHSWKMMILQPWCDELRVDCSS